jgi:ASC-1-like (ASCH) protein
MGVRMISIRIKSEYLEMIRDRTKSLEIRVGYPNILSIRTSDQILFISGSDRQTAAVTDVRRYETFSQMLVHEDFKKIVPGLSKAEVLAILQQIYPPDKEALGVVALDVFPTNLSELIHKYA